MSEFRKQRTCFNQFSLGGSAFCQSVALLITFLCAVANADECSDSISLYGHDGPEHAPKKEGVDRDVVIMEMAALYCEVLQDRALLPIFWKRVLEMAALENSSPDALYEEIESLADSSRTKRSVREEREEREERKRKERTFLLVELEPFLERIGKKHREVIERELIEREMVSPLSAREVQFEFRGKHGFVVTGERSKAKRAVFQKRDGFAIGQVPVTQFMYFLVALGQEGVDSTPSFFKDGRDSVSFYLGGKKYQLKPNHPVEQVNVAEALDHANRVSEIVGGRYGLPSEAQWEFANRAGSKGAYHFGDDLELLPRYGWIEESSEEQTHAVGLLLPNAFHLYDTHGNVFEWTSSTDETSCFVRGGCYGMEGPGTGSGFRRSYPKDVRKDFIGFRLKREGFGKILPSETVTLGKR
jgi:formylglycine-generating enzyme required for sulfatase activity